MLETFIQNPVFHRIWLMVRLPLVIILVLFIGLVIYRIPVVMERAKTEEVVEKIHSQKLTLEDVLGERLPPEPDSALKDATIEGIDANNNGIRDDVELAIFRLHPDSARIRAAELQYAMALQNELTNVFNSETLVAALQQTTRGFLCVGDTGSKVSLSDSQSVVNKAFAITNTRREEVEDLVLNTPARKDKGEQIFDYMTSYGDIKGPNCDIDLVSLPN